jgi:phosphoribosylformimino-5-aminoimidazole carboxamide ribotide isomerase
VIASGGVHNVKDVESLCAVQDEGIEGVICGRSIYEGTLDLRSAQERADELTIALSDSQEPETDPT